jgi:hypothetical protein
MKASESLQRLLVDHAMVCPDLARKMNLTDLLGF